MNVAVTRALTSIRELQSAYVFPIGQTRRFTSAGKSPDFSLGLVGIDNFRFLDPGTLLLPICLWLAWMWRELKNWWGLNPHRRPLDILILPSWTNLRPLGAWRNQMDTSLRLAEEVLIQVLNFVVAPIAQMDRARDS